MTGDKAIQGGAEGLPYTNRAGRAYRYYKVTDSTNIRAKQAAEQGAPHGALFVADEQTAGRGRRGRTWQSPAGKNLYFTLLLRPAISADKASMLTLVMALAVAEGIRRSLNGGAEKAVLQPGIKWPNDVVLDGRKVCGILTELCPGEEGGVRYVVIGAGVNVERQDFPEELSDKAVALEEICGYAVSRSSLLEEIMERFEEYYGIFAETQDLTGLRREYNAILVNRDNRVRVMDPKGEFDGVARGITETGELLVERPDGSVERIYAGEVSVRGIYGYV